MSFSVRLAAGLLFLSLQAPVAQAYVLTAYVDLSEQRMTVMRDGMWLYDWPVSSGRQGYLTPTGDYRATRFSRHHRSRKYNNAPMPYSIFFHGGYAIHGTDQVAQLGRPASHGCIRLHREHAATLFRMAEQAGRANVAVVIRP
ncbi:L,D-transpeptidase [Chachezhania sediminis]|uniref:L,D-transpeptidase n=1 Tax=Chachezhania sediminis TaxID=2599291 RepID=UPI00131B7C38|nr:L,D-transpeptidase [Chachezhania sediminis]